MSDPCPTCQAVIASCPDDDSLYSIQSPIFPFVFECPSGYDCGNAPGFKMVCCGTLLFVDFPPGASADDKTTLIQSIVNQCAVLLSACGQNPGCLNPPCDPPPPTTPLFYNRDATCSINCPDGTTFVYTVVAGTFAALTQADADKQASDYACQQVELRRVCLGSFAACVCVGAPFSRLITHTGGLPPVVLTISSGALPDGLTMTSGGLVSGTPTVSGNFSFHVKARTGDGGFVIKPFQMSVLEIVTTSLTTFEVGTPYSLQLLASGGSGNYAWSITAGSFPSGITMSETGLISGTATANDGVNPLVFNLVDTTCETAQKSIFPPRVTMSTKSTTRIATLLGFSEYDQFTSFPPKKYHICAWAGSSEQKTWLTGPQGFTPIGTTTPVQVAGVRFDYSGQSHINSAGQYTSLYQKDRSEMCSVYDKMVSAFVPLAGLGDIGLQVYPLPGYLGVPGKEACPPPTVPYTFVQDDALGKTQAAIHDSSKLWGSKPVTTFVSESNFNPESGTMATCTDASDDFQKANIFVALIQPVFAPAPAITGLNQGIVWYYAGVTWNHAYSCTLSDEYTDAEALANARVLIGSGSTAENFPRTVGFVSRFTDVIYTMSCVNLIVGKAYLLSVDLADLTSGTTTTVQVGFTADATTKTLINSVPTPPSQHYITVRNPRIAFIP